VCSVIGYIGRANARVNLDVMRDVCAANVRRGPHAFGFAWIDSRGTLRHYKQPGNITSHLPALGMLRDARVALIHLRWATHGDVRNNVNNHPFPVDGGWLIHNGVIGNYRELIHRRRLWPMSECDSEVLSLLIEKSTHYHVMDRVVEAVDEADPETNLAMMAIWKRPNRLVVVRRGQPLSMGSTVDGVYVASLTDGLPGEVRPVKDCNAIRLQQSKGGDINAFVHAISAKPAVKFENHGQGTISYSGSGQYRGG
jgi:glucosamine--fructose-6-phosphate aminotransferase (isomerizing)